MKKYLLIIFLSFSTLLIAQVDNWKNSILINKVKKVSIYRCQYKFGEPEAEGELQSDTIFDEKSNPQMINSSSLRSKVSFYYDENNNLNKMTQYSIDRNTKEEIEIPGFVFKNSYDEKNRLIETIEYGSSGSFMQKTSYQYDEQNILIKKIITKNIYEITLSYKYDINKKLIELSEFSSYNKSTNKTVYKYNKDGYLIEKVIKSDPNAMFWDQSEYNYDMSGHLIEGSTYAISGSSQSITVDHVSGTKVLTEKLKYLYDSKGMLIGKIIFDKLTNEPFQMMRYKYEYN